MIIMINNRRWIVATALSLSLAAGAAIIVRAADEKEEKEGDEQKIKLTEAPAAVQEALKKESNGAKIETIDKEMRDGKQVYEADAIVDGKNHEIIVDADGKVVSNKLDEEGEEKGEKGEMKEKDGEHAEKDEVKVPLEQVPAAVKATFAKESDGAEVKEVERETEKGKVAYETKVKIGNDEYEIKVAEDGKLLKKK
ncbi:MAG TPA: PepSY-like domain-containing protein, partial [Tepidisphaeraceae bacterium]|nr:PepSY-like domain-containing protein [Tepidisphaeraceae bacterium]